MTPLITFVVAAAENGVIGQGPVIPWRMKTDQKRFKAITLGKPIVMGRKTFEAMGRPLPGRTNIVITRDPDYRGRGAIVTTTLAAALDVARGDALRRFATEIMVIGGAEIYRQCLDQADCVDLTIVHANPPGDAIFAPLAPDQWVASEPERHPAGPDDDYDFSYVTYRRR
jgi:dihydrofolate reductase